MEKLLSENLRKPLSSNKLRRIFTIVGCIVAFTFKCLAQDPAANVYCREIDSIVKYNLQLNTKDTISFCIAGLRCYQHSQKRTSFESYFAARNPEFKKKREMDLALPAQASSVSRQCMRGLTSDNLIFIYYMDDLFHNSTIKSLPTLNIYSALILRNTRTGEEYFMGYPADQKKMNKLYGKLKRILANQVKVYKITHELNSTPLSFLGYGWYVE